MRSIALVARTVTERKKTDFKINYSKVILLSIPTLGIYNIITYYRLMKRMKGHYKRQHMLYRDVLTCLQEMADTNGSCADGITNLKLEISDVECEEDALNSGLWIIISLLTLGIGGLYPLYRLTVEPYRHELNESRIIGLINDIILKTNMVEERFENRKCCKKRIFILYLLLTALSLGLFSIYWGYVLVKDFNRHFEEHEQWEIKLLDSLSNF